MKEPIEDFEDLADCFYLVLLFVFVFLVVVGLPMLVFWLLGP